MEGELTLISANERYMGHTGDLFLLNPNQPHELFTQGEVGATILCLQISPRFFINVYPNISDVFFEMVKLENSKNDDLLTNYAKNFVDLTIAYMECRLNYQLFCASKLNEIFYLLLEHVPHYFLSTADQQAIQWKVERINRLLDFVDANFMHKINLQDFAETEGLSLNHLSYFVKENLNQTFREYVANVRYNQACKLLFTQNKRLIDICLESGFSDPRYLTKEFIERTGMRPNEYRRKFAFQEEERQYYRSLHSSQRFYSDEEIMRILKYVRKRL